MTTLELLKTQEISCLNTMARARRATFYEGSYKNHDKSIHTPSKTK